jgi:tetratricopeptide (TPR) repeat protein
MDRKSIKTYLTAICLVLSICLISNAQQKPICVAEAEKMLIEAENTESSEKLSTTKADECIRQNPKSVDALIVRSRILASKADFNAALADANKAIELAPKSSDAFYARGYAYSMSFLRTQDNKHNISAQADYEKSLALNPKNGAALLAKIELASHKSGFRERNIPEINRAIEHLTASNNTAELAHAYFARGLANLFTQGSEGKGFDDLAMALKLRPNYLRVLERRAYANTLGYVGGKPAAIADYTEYLRIKPDPYIYYERGKIYEEMGGKEKAVADYRAALALKPDFSGAQEKLTKLASTPSPKPATAEQLAAESRQKITQRDYDGAIKSSSECLRLKTNAPECYAFRGFAFGMKGDSTAAKTDFEAAIKLAPNQPEIYLMRGLVFLRLGSREDSIKDFRNVLRIDPNNGEAKTALQKLGVQQ